MTDPVQVFIHSGAHRTGTSSFQMCLDQNADALRAAGYDLAYPGRDGIPGGKLMMKLPAPRHGPKQAEGFVDPARAELDAHRQGHARLILSEENIPGRMMHFTKGQFYPAKVQRCRVLRAALPGPVAHMLHVVRPYDELFVSAYRNRAMLVADAPFADYVPKYLKMQEGWPDLMRVFQTHLAPVHLTVVSYAARGSSRSLLSRLLPDMPAQSLIEPRRVLNLSATDAALAESQRRYHAGEVLAPEAVADIVAEHADNRDDLGLAAFSEADRATLRARYEADLDRLRVMPGVNLIEA